MKKTRRYTKVGYTVILAMVLSQGQLGWAGWTGAMNGTGFGVAQVNVVSYKSGEQSTASTARQDPSAAVTVTPGYFAGALLPEDASPATVAKVKGSAGYVWQAETVGSNGDSTDEPELESRVTIIAADCASLAMNTSAVIDETNKTGTIIVNVLGTAGTAMWQRGFELTGGQVPPPDDPATTNKNEFIEFLKANGTLKWDVLNVGLQNLNTTNCNALQIPFTYETSITNLYFVSQGVAKSLPLVIECPQDKFYNCGETVQYPATLQVGGCGNIAVSFNPPLTNALAGSSPFLFGTNLVTVTATDTYSNTASCTFNVIVTDNTAPVPNAASLPDATGQCTATISGPPTATDNCSGTITGTTTNSLTRTTQGTSIVTWQFDDGHGNVSTQTQKIVVTDTTAPLPNAASLPDATGQCTATISGPPTATDNCSGTITGTTTNSLTRTTQGTSIVTWQFDDGHGNVSTQTQKIVVTDTTAPAIPSLPTVTGSCGASVTVTNPTTTDNCVGTVTGTTSDPLTYTNAGTYIVHWTFGDGNGNTNTANQTVIVGSLTLQGFYSPIGTQGNDCGTTTVTVNKGNVIPIKFDLLCGTSPVTIGILPTVKIQEYPDCSTPGSFISSPAVYQNDWHANWDTNLARKNYKYRISVIVNGAEIGFVWVKVK